MKKKIVMKSTYSGCVSTNPIKISLVKSVNTYEGEIKNIPYDSNARANRISHASKFCR